MATKHKINSMTLESGVTVNYRDDGMIELSQQSFQGVVTQTVSIHTTDLDTIRLQAIKNGRIEAGSNGTLPVNKETVKS